MKPKETGEAYNQITHLWNDDGFNRSNGIEQHKRAMVFAKNHGKALDVGCGSTGRFIDLLLQEGFQPEGVDVSTKMLELARERHPQIEFYHQDICEWTLPRSYDFITAWDSIWHIPLDQQENVLTKLVNGLNPQGVLIFSFGGTEQAREHDDDYMGPTFHYSTLGVNGFVDLLIRLGCLIRHLEFDQPEHLHAYIVVQKP